MCKVPAVWLPAQLYRTDSMAAGYFLNTDPTCWQDALLNMIVAERKNHVPLHHDQRSQQSGEDQKIVSLIFLAPAFALANL